MNGEVIVAFITDGPAEAMLVHAESASPSAVYTSSVANAIVGIVEETERRICWIAGTGSTTAGFSERGMGRGSGDVGCLSI